VIVTLWPLNDGEARDFMKDFYRNWLSQARSDPAKALRDTQSVYLKKDDPALRLPRVLIE
jgi:CHAT domain-containing protein